MKDNNSRARKLDHIKLELNQALKLIDMMSVTPNQPMIIVDQPIWGINILDKIGAIEIFEDPTRTHFADVDADGEKIMKPLTMAIARS